MKYIKIIVVMLSLVGLLGLGTASASPLNGGSLKIDLVSSSNASVRDACSALSSISSAGCSNGNSTVKSIARAVVEVLSFVIGIISIIMIIISAFRFITAGGDTNNVAAAKNTLIYAIIGLVIAVLAQFLVHNVLNTATNIQNNSFLNNQTDLRHDG
jgi:Type IV secretion system pilin